MHNKRFLLTLPLLVILLQGILIFADKTTDLHWLKLGPAPVPSLESKLLKNDAATLKFNHIEINGLLPQKNGSLTWLNKQSLKWQTTTTTTVSSSQPAVLYLATYLDPLRQLKASLIIKKNPFKISVFLDGKKMDSTT
ncbi:MAG: hypothetical protein GY765_37610, partial [bacterium]|nr:hypothetical protein [bacterium]